MNSELWLYVLASLFIIAGIGIAFIPSQANRFVSKIYTWPQVAADVIKIEECTHDVTFYRPKCEYTINSTTFLSQPKHEYPNRADIPNQMLVFVNPHNFRDIYCERDLKQMHSVSSVAYLMAACFLFGGFGVLAYSQFFER